jgi:hypothetical protein
MTAAERAAAAEEKAEKLEAALRESEGKDADSSDPPPLKLIAKRSTSSLSDGDVLSESKYDSSKPPMSPSNLRLATLKSPKLSRSASGLFGAGKELTSAFGYIIEAWVQFDTKGHGFITK